MIDGADPSSAGTASSAGIAPVGGVAAAVTGKAVTAVEVRHASFGGLADSPAPAEFTMLLATIFGGRLELAERYVRWLAGPGVERGLIGPREAPRLWDRHILNCVAAGAVIPVGARVLDLGSGAGLPGVVLAIARPDLSVVLVDSLLRRCEFLGEVVRDLELANVDVRRARAEELRPLALGVDVVTARAVGPIANLASLAAPLLRAGGQLVALKGTSAAAEVEAAWPDLQRSAMAVGAALLSVIEAPKGISGAAAIDPPSFIAGLEVTTEVAWEPDGQKTSFAAGREPIAAAGPAVPIAHVVRLGRGGHGSHKSARLV